MALPHEEPGAAVPRDGIRVDALQRVVRKYGEPGALTEPRNAALRAAPSPVAAGHGTQVRPAEPSRVAGPWQAVAPLRAGRRGPSARQDAPSLVVRLGVPPHHP
ncbi:hypothetical protein [Bradyrhizobium macuxiense]|uniref:hypothetical protein n=1 Tax=Bradyrhizobium macuxiense TaxID=1755647 RepID=UPI001FED73C2|nr:hypothetical protein [Bradyrhizobium macuxiense]